LDNLGSENYEKMASNGNKAVMQKYNWEFDNKVLLNLYADLNSIKNIA
jgi:hypothetical protein